VLCRQRLQRGWLLCRRSVPRKRIDLRRSAGPARRAARGWPGPARAPTGSCQTSAGTSCGKVNEPCCDLSTCTASQSSCLMGMTMCSACGGTGQPCCKPNGCLDGRACINGGVGRIGTCQTCGGMGEPCCGTASPPADVQRGFELFERPGMGNLCSSDANDAAGPGGSDGATPDAAFGFGTRHVGMPAISAPRKDEAMMLQSVAPVEPFSSEPSRRPSS